MEEPFNLVVPGSHGALSAEHAGQQSDPSPEPTAAIKNIGEEEQGAINARKCGGRIVEDEIGTLSFPGDGRNYTNNQTCTWRIHVPFRKTIRLRFKSIDIPNTTEECSESDHVSLYDGYRYGTLLGNVCGKEWSRQFRSHSSIIGVVFHSDNDGLTGLGFNLQFVAVTGNIGNRNPFARGGDASGSSGVNASKSFAPRTTRQAQPKNPSSNPLAMLMSFSLSQLVTRRPQRIDIPKQRVPAKVVPVIDLKITNETKLCDVLEKTLSNILHNIQVFEEVSYLASDPSEIIELKQLQLMTDQAVLNTLSTDFENSDFENSECVRNISSAYNTILSKIIDDAELAPTSLYVNPTIESEIVDPLEIPVTDMSDIIQYLDLEDTEKLCQELNTSLTETIGSLWLLLELGSIVTDEKTPIQFVIDIVRENLFNLIDQVDWFESIAVNATCLQEIKDMIPEYLNFTSYIEPDDDVIDEREEFICSTELTEAQGVMYSPGFPRGYPNEITCEWFITARPSKLIAVKFIRFKMDSVAQVTGCDRSYDYIEVVYWWKGKIRKVDVYCGVIPPPVIVSLSNKVSLILRTNDRVTNEGFIAVYTEVNKYPIPDPSKIVFPTQLADAFVAATNAPVVTEADAFRVLIKEGSSGMCVHYLVGEQGEFSSREMFADSRKPNHCVWNIMAEPWKYITLHLSFDLSPRLSGVCDHDRAYIVIVQSNSSIHDEPLCGKRDMQLTSPGNSIRIVVNLNDQPDASFEARYITQDNPNMQQRLYAHGGGVQQPTSAFSDVFPSCGEVLKSAEGVITSPNYPAEFTTNINCLWSILANHEEYIILKFDDFDLDSKPVSQKCDDLYSMVTIHYIADRIVSKDFCGTGLPHVIVSKGDQLTITFKSLNGYGRGFSAKYKTIAMGWFSAVKAQGLDYYIAHGYKRKVEQSTTVAAYDARRIHINSYVDVEDVNLDCSFRLNDTFDVFSSPVNTNGFYPHDLVCKWDITATSSSRVSLHITDFDLDSPSSDVCDTQYSYVTVLRTNEEGIVEVSRHCGVGTVPVVSSFGHLVVLFHSKRGIGTGFKARYILNDLSYITRPTELSGCVFWPEPGSGEIEMSTDSVDAYQTSNVCVWNLLPVPDKIQSLYLSFESFQPDTITCLTTNPYVIVTYTDSAWRVVDDVICGTHQQTEFTSVSGNMMINLFNIDKRTTFKAFYSSEIGGRRIKPETESTGPPCLFAISGDEGEFDNYQTSAFSEECVWKITVDSKFVIVLTFEETQLQDCNQLIVVDVREGVPFEVDTCGIQQNAFLSSSNYLEIKRLKYSQLEFKFKYTAVDPLGYGFRMLRPPAPRSTTTVRPFRSLPLMNRPTQGDVFPMNVSTIKPHFQTTLQERYLPRTTKQSIAPMTVPPISSTDVVCGGNLRALNGTILSPRYPRNYPEATQCTWTILVGDASFIVLDFIDFDVGTHSLPEDCEEMYGYLDILSLPNERALMRLCGKMSPQSFFTNSSSVKIVLFTNYGLGRGFHLKYYKIVTGVTDYTVTESPFRKLPEQTIKTPCIRTYVEENGAFHSPGYPNGNTRNINCKWEIISPNNEYIMLEFKVFDLGQKNVEFNSKCSKAHSYVKISNVRTEKSYTDITFCGNRRPGIIVSYSTHLLISMMTRDYKVKGFYANFKEVKETYISSVLKGESLPTTVSYENRPSTESTKLPVTTPYTRYISDQLTFTGIINTTTKVTDRARTTTVSRNNDFPDIDQRSFLHTPSSSNITATVKTTNVTSSNITTTRWFPGMRRLGEWPSTESTKLPVTTPYTRYISDQLTFTGIINTTTKVTDRARTTTVSRNNDFPDVDQRSFLHTPSSSNITATVKTTNVTSSNINTTRWFPGMRRLGEWPSTESTKLPVTTPYTRYISDQLTFTGIINTTTKVTDRARTTTISRNNDFPDVDQRSFLHTPSSSNITATVKTTNVTSSNITTTRWFPGMRRLGEWPSTESTKLPVTTPYTRYISDQLKFTGIINTTTTVADRARTTTISRNNDFPDVDQRSFLHTPSSSNITATVKTTNVTSSNINTTRWFPGMRRLGEWPHPAKNSTKRKFTIPVAAQTTEVLTTSQTTSPTIIVATTAPKMATPVPEINTTSQLISTTAVHATESKQKANLLSKSEARLALYLAVGIAGMVALLFLVLVAVCTRNSRSIDIQAAHQDILHPTYRTWGSPPSRFPAENERLV
ncbi:uncharacterized protein [Antedon mediterranea]|uniref:uncharacterized protein n=1 Tax=Antedon mediterranea TaxID=105859 RepID=UPI003AF7EA2A